MKLKDLIESNNTGLDAIKRAPIVDYDTGVRCLRIGDISNNRPFNEWGYTEVEDNNYSKFQLKTGDIIVARTGATIGVNKYIDKDYKSVYNNGLIRIRVKKENNPKYVYYLLQSTNYKNFIKTISMGTSTQPNMQMNDLLNLEVPDFDKPKQDKIVEILEKIDDKIGLNNEINNNLYEMGDNLYNEYFGKYKDNLPSDYNIVKLNEVADNFDSKRKPMSSREREQHRGIYPYYGATSIIDYVDDYIFDDTYLLMGEDGTVKTDDGYPVLQYIWGKNWINNHAHVLKGKNISTELLMFALRKINIENIITGAVQPKINQENMNKIEFVIGSDSKNKELEDILKKLMDKSKNIIEENKRLEELRETLLPKLMNGEIDLDKIEL